MGNKKVVRCAHCEDAVIDWGVGFMGSKSYFCSQRNQPVDNDDGCTFGTPGHPSGYICRESRVDHIDPTVYG